MSSLEKQPSKAFKWVIFDIDGVLANNLHRVPLLNQKRYDEYYGPLVLKDVVIVDNVEILESYKRQGYFVSLWTARNESCRHFTEQWLRDARIPYDELLMRRERDLRPAHYIKADWLTAELAKGNKPITVFDDDPANIANYEKHDIHAIYVTTLGKHPYTEEIKHDSDRASAEYSAESAESFESA